MKITYFTNDYPKVSHSFIRREIQALERQGFEIQRIALRGWTGSLPDAEDQAERTRTTYLLRSGSIALLLPTLVTMLRTPRRFLTALHLTLRLSRGSDRPLPYHLAYLAEACRMLPWLKAAQSQAIHAHFGTNSTNVAMLAGLLAGIPYSFTVHGPEEFMRPVGLPEKIRRCAFVVAISSYGRSQLSLHTPFANWDKIKVIHCGLEPRFYMDAPTAASATGRLVCVGRLVAEKGQLLLVEAIASLRACGIDVELVLAGDGPLRQLLERRIDELGIAGQVRITGWISGDQVRQEILAARALVLPSFAEGLPVVLMEAMALRRPVITTYIAGIPELVQDGTTGWLVPAASLENLLQALRACLQLTEEQLHAVGSAAFTRVTQRHGIDAQAALLASHFRALTDRACH